MRIHGIPETLIQYRSVLSSNLGNDFEKSNSIHSYLEPNFGTLFGSFPSYNIPPVFFYCFTTPFLMSPSPVPGVTAVIRSSQFHLEKKEKKTKWRRSSESRDNRRYVNGVVTEFLSFLSLVFLLLSCIVLLSFDSSFFLVYISFLLNAR